MQALLGISPKSNPKSWKLYESKLITSMEGEQASTNSCGERQVYLFSFEDSDLRETRQTLIHHGLGMKLMGQVWSWGRLAADRVTMQGKVGKQLWHCSICQHFEQVCLWNKWQNLTFKAPRQLLRITNESLSDFLSQEESVGPLGASGMNSGDKDSRENRLRLLGHRTALALKPVISHKMSILTGL